MPDHQRSGERWSKASRDAVLAIPSAALLRGTVAGMKCREQIRQQRPGEATLLLSLMHDAIASLVDVELDEANQAELAKLVDLERHLASELRRPR